MKALALLMLVLAPGQVPQESDWDPTPAAVMVTATNIWRVNKGQGVSKQGDLIKTYPQAQLSTHKQQKHRNNLVLQPGARVPLATKVANAGTVPAKSNEAAAMDLLVKLGLQMPSSDKASFSTVQSLGEIEELKAAAADPSQTPLAWILAGKTYLTDGKDKNLTVPVSDQSVMIEWAHRDQITQAEAGLKKANSNRAGDTSPDGEKIYNKHNYKFPIKVTVWVSSDEDAPGTAPKEVALADPLYLVRPRFLKKGADNKAEPKEEKGYLMYLDSSEKDTGYQIIGLEVPTFQVSESANGTTVSAKLSSACFLEKIVQVAVKAKRKNLVLRDLDDSKAPPGTTKNFVTEEGVRMLKLDFEAWTAAVAPAKTEAESAPAAPPVTEDADPEDGERKLLDYLVESNAAVDDGKSYTVVLSQVASGPDTFEESYPLVVFDSKCNQLAVPSQNQKDAEKAPAAPAPVNPMPTPTEAPKAN